MADRPTASPFEIHIYAAMAEEERRKISQRTRAALAVKKAQLAQEGRKLGNPNPLKALVIAAEQAPAATPQAAAVCNGKYKSGLKPEWVKDGGPDNPNLANDPDERITLSSPPGTSLSAGPLFFQYNIKDIMVCFSTNCSDTIFAPGCGRIF